MKIVIASNNKEKIREFKEILTPLNFKVLSKKEANANFEVEETGKTFKENAEIKATAIFKKVNMPTLADDSGLEVFALNNKPGIFSARYSEEEGKKATDENNNTKLLKEMENVKNREARFVCALCFINSKGEIFNILETVEGKIATSLKGENGFGYDPLFIYNNKSFAQIPASLKNKISHRGKAISKFLANIKNWVWI